MPSVALGTTFVGPGGETFKTTDFLGQGAFGEVYRAAGEQTGTVVAIKLLPLGILAAPDSKMALLNEIRAAQQIKHPNVVQVLHVNDGTSSAIGPYVVLEYVSGGSLAKILRAGTDIPLERAHEMMVDIAQGARAISEKLIHRDIKPDNVLVEGGKLKIGDFGISKFVDENTRRYTFKGAQHIWYMAPEGWDTEANTIQIDVYSVGLMFYEILTRKHPLLPYVNDTSNFRDWRNAHLYRPCPDVRSLRVEVPLSVAQLLLRMVNKRPGDRPFWDEVLKVLTQPAVASTMKNPTVAAAVEAAVARRQELQRKELAQQAQQDEREQELALYRYACGELLEKFDPIIEEFNREFQDGEITRSGDVAVVYHIPLGQTIVINFYQPKRLGIRIRNGELIGGGHIGLARGRSANLVLLKTGPDDLYGRWSICELKFMALINPASLIGKFGISGETVEPFGLNSEHFYDQMRYATGMMHVFNYHFDDDVVGFFATLIREALVHRREQG